MGEILRNWIQARLGVMMDLRPDVFGYYTRDGTLLAQVLHSYDIISQGQLDTIIHTDDPALCRVNLKHLTFWLRFVGVECDDDSIEEISCAKGTTSLRLFYKLYLCLETKDRLHFVTLQKEREKYVPTSKKFEVTKVCEDPPPYRPPEHPLAKKLVKGCGAIEWHRSKIPSVLRKVKNEREKILISAMDTSEIQTERCEVETPEKMLDRKLLESEEMDAFARAHRVRRSRRTKAEETEIAEETKDSKLETNYVEDLKKRRKREATRGVLRAKIRKELLSELWDRMAERQEKSFDKVLAGHALDHSRYEKQMLTKLCEVRDQKNIMAENQKLVEDITLAAKEVEHRANYELEKDLASMKQKDIETECERMCELRHRLLAAKIDRIRKKHRRRCRRLLDDLITVAINMANHRSINDGHIPQTLLAEWKSLFLNCQPIFVEAIPYRPESQDSLETELKLFYKTHTCVSPEKMELLRDVLFDDYLRTNPPWNRSIESLIDDEERKIVELGGSVLGYVVHRLLDGLYPKPLNRARSVLPKIQNVAIVLGIRDPTICESIRALLESSDIRVIKMEDAINYCLERYKEEMSDVEYIDATILAATSDIVKDVLSGNRRLSEGKWTVKSVRRPKFSQEMSIDDVAKRTKKDSQRISEENEEEAPWKERQTQTPRNIPFDDLDPILTDSAYMGKWAYEFLTLGQPISNDLATKILLEYLKSLSNVKGWVLLDYPVTYEQMSLLESTLTGSTPPPDPKGIQLEDITIEDIEDTVPRLVFEDESDPYASNRQSKLVSDPITSREEISGKRPFATLFVRVAQQPKSFEIGEETYEALTENTASIDRFYAAQKIAYVFYYATLDLPALKTLARLLIGEPTKRKPSEELFGEALTRFERDGRRGTTAKPSVIRRLLTEDEIFEMELYRDAMEEEETRYSTFDDFSVEIENRPLKPGDRNWQWIDFPLSSILMEHLGKLWEGIENVYTTELKELLFLKSLHASSVGPYVDFLARNAQKFAKRPDVKRNLLRDFQRGFNAVDPDARNDADVKCELHRRVADFQAELWEICDDRRHGSERERVRRVEEQWTMNEAIVLFNVHVGIVQAELDRHFDTVRLLEDYYLGMLKKPLDEVPNSKVTLNKIPTSFGEETFLHDPPPSPSTVEKSTDRKKKEQKVRQSKDTGTLKATSGPPAAIEQTILSDQIKDLFIDTNKSREDLEAICLYKGILQNISYARILVSNLSDLANETINREQLAADKSKDYPTDAGDSVNVGLSSRIDDLILEWRYALAYEVERVKSKLDSVESVARLDVSFLLETLQRTFYGIYEFILNRYWREMKSVNEMADVFCFAIEEGRSLPKEMILDGDRFGIRSNVYTMDLETKSVTILKPELPSPERFRIARLNRLLNFFKRIAPDGILSVPSFIYVLQDLASHGFEEGDSAMALPCSWYSLRQRDIVDLVSQLFQRTDFIEWREFLIYAMDLPIPNSYEILVARDRFRIQDPELREVVTRSQFARTPLWFLECEQTCGVLQDLLNDEFEYDRQDLYDDEVCQFDPIRRSTVRSENVSFANLPGCCDDEILRRSLAREVLCRMFMVDRESVNYTALLLAFCKDEDPREGFAKALALAIGNKVCSDVADGERYVEELLRRGREAMEEGVSVVFSRQQTLEVVQSILNRLIYNVSREIDHDLTAASSSALKLFQSSMEQYAALDSISSGELGGEEASKDSLWDRLAKEHETVAYWVSLELCLTVLAAALPWHTQEPHILGSSSCMRDKLHDVFKELWDPELNDRKNVVLIHRLLNHDFMKHLFNCVSKFSVKKMSTMVQELLSRESKETGKRFAHEDSKKC